MAKINATYSSGYYIAPDTDYRKLEEEQQLERKRKRRLEKDGHADASDASKAIRQTFAIPFNVICLHCNCRIARGTHGYVNRRPTEKKYMGIRIWELEFRCIFCKEHIYLTTDYETAKLTGGYHCGRGCRRGEGDFYGTNQINEAVRAGQAEAAAKSGSLDALERENEAVRRLQERERLVEELVESRADTEDVRLRDELLHAIREKEQTREEKRRAKGRQQQHAEGATTHASDDDDDDDDGRTEEADEEAYQRFEAQLRAWKEETRRAQEEQSKKTTDDSDKVAAMITAKYNTHGEKQNNVFMDESDSDDNSDKGKMGNVKVQMREDCTASVISKTSSAAGTFSRPRKGGALASLLDD